MFITRFSGVQTRLISTIRLSNPVQFRGETPIEPSQPLEEMVSIPFPKEKNSMFIGRKRDPNTKVALLDPNGELLSRIHLMVCRGPENKFYVVDTSSHGTFNATEPTLGSSLTMPLLPSGRHFVTAGEKDATVNVERFQQEWQSFAVPIEKPTTLQLGLSRIKIVVHPDGSVQIPKFAIAPQRAVVKTTYRKPPFRGRLLWDWLGAMFRGVFRQ